MQMGVTKTKFCDFVVWSNKETLAIRLHFDEHFWNDVKAKLIDFHHSYLCPEIFEMKPLKLKMCFVIFCKQYQGSISVFASLSLLFSNNEPSFSLSCHIHKCNLAATKIWALLLEILFPWYLTISSTNQAVQSRCKMAWNSESTWGHCTIYMYNNAREKQRH